MELYTDTGIVIRKRPYKETGIIFKVFLEGKGMYSFLLKGTGKSGLLGRIESTNLIEISWMAREERNLYIPKKVRLIEEYLKVKENYTILKEVSAILKDLEKFLPDNAISPTIFKVLLLFLKGVEEGRDILAGKAWFYRELLRELGVLPEFTHCGRCGGVDDLHILKSGIVVCNKCIRADDSILEGDKAILSDIARRKMRETQKILELLMTYRNRLI